MYIINKQMKQNEISRKRLLAIIEFLVHFKIEQNGHVCSFRQCKNASLYGHVLQ